MFGMKVYGPYVHRTGPLVGRRYMTIINDDGSRTSMMYARYLMQQVLGRELGSDEHVDHVDEDFTNDAVTNLQVLTPVENKKKYHRLRGPKVEMITFVCPQCGKVATKPATKVRSNRRQGKAGPFCGRSCAVSWQQRHRKPS